MLMKQPEQMSHFMVENGLVQIFNFVGIHIEERLPSLAYRRHATGSIQINLRYLRVISQQKIHMSLVQKLSSIFVNVILAPAVTRSIASSIHSWSLAERLES